ncbi:hypothetical protein V7147_09700 [Bacillus sp. JJ1521]|uniref:hypothetical protein n=1 Tax=Bacillus sp. JJ1521 TaxID=3122957 RepID=UPI002FFED1DA
MERKTKQVFTHYLNHGWILTDLIKVPNNNGLYLYLIKKKRIDIEIKSILLRYMRMRLLNPFKTSVGTISEKVFILVEVKSKNGLL